MGLKTFKDFWIFSMKLTDQKRGYFVSPRVLVISFIDECSHLSFVKPPDVNALVLYLYARIFGRKKNIDRMFCYFRAFSLRKSNHIYTCAFEIKTSVHKTPSWKYQKTGPFQLIKHAMLLLSLEGHHLTKKKYWRTMQTRIT